MQNNLMGVHFQKTCLLLDVDENFVPSTHRVITKDQQKLFWDLHHVLDGAIALVTNSDRRSIDVETFLPGFPCVSEHGAVFRLNAHGTPENTAPQFFSDIVAPHIRLDLKKQGVQLTEDSAALQKVHSPAVIVEEKEAGIAIVFGEHECLRDPITAVARTNLEHFNDNAAFYVDDTGRDTIEIKAVGFAKEKSLDRIMKHPNFVGRTPIIFGDSGPDRELAREAFERYNGYAFFRGDGIEEGLPFEARRLETYQDVFERLKHYLDDFTMQRRFNQGRTAAPLILRSPMAR
jgi:trehalose-6-phosphatase